MPWLYVPEESEILPRLARIEVKIDRLMRAEHKLEIYEMATKETLDRLTAQVAANTDGVASAKLALEGFVKSNEDLTKALQEALARDDEVAVKAAADAIAANNDTLRAAIPAVSTAVVANT